MTEPADDRSGLAKGFAWSSEVISIALESVVPGLIGLWIDRRLGTVLIFLVLGGALGMTLGLWHLVRLTKALSSGQGPGRGRQNQPPDSDSQENAR